MWKVSLLFWDFLLRHSHRIRWFPEKISEWISVFCLNVGNYGPQRLGIRILCTLWVGLNITTIISTQYIDGFEDFVQKMKFSIRYFFSKCDQIRSFLRIWSHLLKKSLMENFIFCAMKVFIRPRKSYSLINTVI